MITYRKPDQMTNFPEFRLGANIRKSPSPDDPFAEQPGTMEQYIFRLLANVESKLKQLPAVEGMAMQERVKFHSLASQRDILYMILTGHNNPLCNAKQEL
jgi:hypothetical protein